MASTLQNTFRWVVRESDAIPTFRGSLTDVIFHQTEAEPLDGVLPLESSVLALVPRDLGNHHGAREDADELVRHLVDRRAFASTTTVVPYADVGMVHIKVVDALVQKKKC